MQEVVSVRENVISFLLAQCDARDRQIAELQTKLAALVPQTSTGTAAGTSYRPS